MSPQNQVFAESDPKNDEFTPPTPIPHIADKQKGPTTFGLQINKMLSPGDDSKDILSQINQSAIDKTEMK